MDFALNWMDPSDKSAIPVIMPANDKRAGGDWEAGISPLPLLYLLVTLHLQASCHLKSVFAGGAIYMQLLQHQLMEILLLQTIQFHQKQESILRKLVSSFTWPLLPMSMLI